MGSMSIWHWLIVALVILLLFGKGRISDIMGETAKGIKAFKKGMADEDTPSPPRQVTSAPPAESASVTREEANRP
jgi:sec-independent protein translocase protein TatA